MHLSGIRWHGQKIRVALAVALLASIFLSIQLSKPAQAAGSTYYVSKNGSNADGRSWSTAWNELDQINWGVVQPGDTILLDGGSSQMVYNTALIPTKSGTSSAPIAIKLATDSGRNGKVAIFGGRSTPLPYCYQSSYTYQTAGVVSIGIDVNNVSWLTIDGGKWSGITIYGHNKYGIDLHSSASNITVRNVEIYDNGNATFSNNSWYPDQPGISPAGSNNTIERALIHDNGQDSFQSSGGISNLTIRQSWLYNSRTHPSGPDIAWNYCRHSDGIQVYNGGIQTGLTIDQSIIGPGLLQGTLLGQSGSYFAQFNNVTLTNSLFINAANANMMAYVGTSPQNWKIDHVTSYVYRNTNKAILGGYNYDLQLQGSNHSITNSIFYDGRIDLSAATNVQSSGNCTYNLISGSVNGTNADPQFVALPPSNPPTLQDSINANYALKAGSPCAGLGSSITSVAQLLGQSAPAPTASPTPATPVPTAVATSTPVPGKTPTVAPSPTSTVPPKSTATATPSSGGSAFTFYGDALAPGWKSSGWGATVNPASTTYVYSGKDAVEYTINSRYGAFSPVLSSGTFDTSAYTNIRFYINGEKTGGQKLGLMFRNANTQTWGKVVRIDGYISGGSVAANQWRQVDIPISALGLTSTKIDRIALQDVLGTTQPTVSIDDIELYNAAAP